MSAAPVLVILAGGASSRLGESKALVDLAGINPMCRLFAAAASFCDDDPILVAGPDFDAIKSAAPTGLEVLENRNWSTGRTSSLQAALRSRPQRDFLVAPVDVPLVPKEVFELLAGEWRTAGAPPKGWLAPAVRMKGELRTGHPVVIGRELAARTEKFTPDTPLRELRSHAEPMWRVETESHSILDDLDTPLDLKTFRARLGDLS